MRFNVYTDGGARPNPGEGGHGFVICDKEDKLIAEGFCYTKDSTNNREEIKAVITAINMLPQNSVLTITTDSQYVCNAINKGWLTEWEQKGELQQNKRLNSDLWKILLSELEKMADYEFVWIKGHAGHVFNTRCDELATKAIETKTSDLTVF